MWTTHLSWIIRNLVLLKDVNCGIRCFTCNDDNSMKDCSKHQKSTDCQLNEQCYMASFKLFSAWQFHNKGCVAKTQCNGRKLCGAKDEDCLVRSPIRTLDKWQLRKKLKILQIKVKKIIIEPYIYAFDKKLAIFKTVYICPRQAYWNF